MLYRSLDLSKKRRIPHLQKNNFMSIFSLLLFVCHFIIAHGSFLGAQNVSKTREKFGNILEKA